MWRVVDAKHPRGREAVREALTRSTLELIARDGSGVSIRQIASHAGVNHGLVHRYFGNRDALIKAALDDLNDDAVGDLDDDGVPDANISFDDLQLLARVLARLSFDEVREMFTPHRVMGSWVETTKRDNPELADGEAEALVAASTTLVLGWTVFGDFVQAALGVGDSDREALDVRVLTITAELGRLVGRNRTPSHDE
jgi:AcrR family transcriptional regulator